MFVRYNMETIKNENTRDYSELTLTLAGMCKDDYILL